MPVPAADGAALAPLRSGLLPIRHRARAPGEIDTFHWYCDSCDKLLHVETYTVDDYKADPVSRAYERFNSSDDFRTCKKCGTLRPPVVLTKS